MPKLISYFLAVLVSTSSPWFITIHSSFTILNKRTHDWSPKLWPLHCPHVEMITIWTFGNSFTLTTAAKTCHHVIVIWNLPCYFSRKSVHSCISFQIYSMHPCILLNPHGTPHTSLCSVCNLPNLCDAFLTHHVLLPLMHPHTPSPIQPHASTYFFPHHLPACWPWTCKYLLHWLWDSPNQGNWTAEIAITKWCCHALWPHHIATKILNPIVIAR